MPVRPWRFFSLEEQVKHVDQFISDTETLSAGYGEKIILVGHSIGAYIAIEALARRTRSNIFKGVVGIMPFLEANFRDSSYVSKDRWLRGWMWPVMFLLAFSLHVIGLLPHTFKQFFLRGNTATMDSKAKDFTVANMLRFSAITNYLFLGRSEFIHHLAPFDWTRLGSFRSHSHFLYTTDDMWAPVHCFKQAQNTGVDATLLEGVPHGFSVGPASGNQRICSWLSEKIVDLSRHQDR